MMNPADRLYQDTPIDQLIKWADENAAYNDIGDTACDAYLEYVALQSTNATLLEKCIPLIADWHTFGLDKISTPPIPTEVTSLLKALGKRIDVLEEAIRKAQGE